MTIETVALSPIYCSNPFCRSVMKGGKRQIVGECDTPGVKLRLRCAACREVRVYVATA